MSLFMSVYCRRFDLSSVHPASMLVLQTGEKATVLSALHNLFITYVRYHLLTTSGPSGRLTSVSILRRGLLMMAVWRCSRMWGYGSIQRASGQRDRRYSESKSLREGRKSATWEFEMLFEFQNTSMLSEWSVGDGRKVKLRQARQSHEDMMWTTVISRRRRRQVPTTNKGASVLSISHSGPQWGDRHSLARQGTALPFPFPGPLRGWDQLDQSMKQCSRLKPFWLIRVESCFGESTSNKVPLRQLTPD